jgi:predicted MPP superfamily phosphohydrolase
MNTLVYYQARKLLPVRTDVRSAFIFFLLLMVMAPICTRLLERNGYEWPATLTAYAGYYWMGFVFLSLWGFLAIGVVGLASRLVNTVLRTNLPSFSGKIATAFVFTSVLAICVYGHMEARCVTVERIQVKTDKLPERIHRLKIAQISDVHLGIINGKNRLQTIVGLIHEEKPDLLVSTGDLVDGDMAGDGEIQQLLRQIQPSFGKYAVTGNHEFYAGLTQALETMDRAGFRVLRGEATTIDGVLNIVGIDDPAIEPITDERSLLASTGNRLFTLFLKHRPEVLQESLGLFDLQLSGHTHRGQIFPFRLFTGLAYPLQNGLHDLEAGSKIYTSRGSGTWGPPMRVLSPPEVTIIELFR